MEKIFFEQNISAMENFLSLQIKEFVTFVAKSYIQVKHICMHEFQIYPFPLHWQQNIGSL